MANTLKLGAGKWATGKDTVLSFNDENGNFKPLPFSFSRASKATVVNQSGLIETVGSGEPRIDFKDDAKGALKLEPQRTNLFEYSESFSNSYWTKNGSTETIGYLAPDGTLNAYKLIANATDSSIYKVFSVTSGTTYSLSFYLKTVSGTLETTIGLGSPGFPNTSGDGGRYKSITVTNEWKRYTLTSTADATASSGISFGGFGGFTTGEEVLIYGAQLEVGSYATSYIPTSGSAVTRVYDTMPNYLDVKPLNIGNSYTLFLDADLNVNDNNKVFSLINNSSNITSFTFRNNIGGIRLYNHIDASYPIYKITSSNNKFAIRVDGNSYKVFVQGSSLSGTLTTQRDLGSLNFYGQNTELKINNFTINDTALSDAECEALVS